MQLRDDDATFWYTAAHRMMIVQLFSFFSRDISSLHQNLNSVNGETLQVTLTHDTTLKQVFGGGGAAETLANAIWIKEKARQGKK